MMYRSFQPEGTFATIAKAGKAMTLPSTRYVRAAPAFACDNDTERAYRPFGPTSWAGGEGPGDISLDTLNGMWTLRFGMFGCRDSETRGGAIYVEEGRLFGGDNNFAYHGDWGMCGTELQASLNIVRHDHGSGRETLFGTSEQHYVVDCVAEAISTDHIEGRIRRPGFPDARLTMRRLPMGAC